MVEGDEGYTSDGVEEEEEEEEEKADPLHPLHPTPARPTLPPNGNHPYGRRSKVAPLAKGSLRGAPGRVDALWHFLIRGEASQYF